MADWHFQRLEKEVSPLMHVNIQMHTHIHGSHKLWFLEVSESLRKDLLCKFYFSVDLTVKKRNKHIKTKLFS